MLGQHETGNETYIRNLVAEARTLERAGVRLTAAVSPGQEHGILHAIVHPRIHDDVLRLTRLLPQLARKTAADLVHVTYHGPLVMSTPMVVTIHDVSYRVRARFYGLRNLLIQNILGYWTARRARLILTVSEFCRTEIERVYPFVRGRVAVTYSATEPAPPPPPDQIETLLNHLGLRGGQFVFSLGLFQPRKNLLRLARSFCTAFGNQTDVRLVLAGYNATPTGDAIRKEFADFIAGGRIVLPGYIDSSDATALYSRCACFAFPSLYEGFGSPLVEAMRLGAPVVTSATTALPEVAGDAALLVDPEDEAAIASALRKVLSTPDLATSMRARGQARALRFSGAQFAAALAAAYHHAMSGTGP